MSAYLDRRQGGQRIALEAPVRILLSGEQRTILASTRNISATGMFVSAPELCGVDARLLCDISLPARPSLPLWGRVAWVQQPPDPGMGIEFVDLSDSDRSLLQGVVQTPPQHGQPVKVWFETLAQPIRAKVQPTADGVLLRSRLPFLRLSSQVLVYPEGGQEGYSATLRAVTLRCSDDAEIPELQVLLSLPPEIPPDAAGSDAEERPRGCWQAAGEILVQQHAAPSLVPEPSVQTALGVALLENNVPVDPPPRSAALPAPQRRAARRPLWLGAALGLLVAGGLAVLVLAGQGTTSDGPEPAPKLDRPALPTPTPTPAASTPDAERRLPVLPAREPQVTVSADGRQRLVVPLDGTTAGAVHYPLANPDGLVVNLPAARPRVPFGDYNIAHGAIRLLWLHRRGDGVHVRVLFAGKAPAHRVVIGEQVIQVVLEPGADAGAPVP